MVEVKVEVGKDVLRCGSCDCGPGLLGSLTGAGYKKIKAYNPPNGKVESRILYTVVVESNGGRRARMKIYYPKVLLNAD